MDLKSSREVSPKELHERRKQAVILHKKGMKLEEIGEVVGAHRNTVGRWIKVWREQGAESLKPFSPGRPHGSGRRLDPEQEKLPS